MKITREVRAPRAPNLRRAKLFLKKAAGDEILSVDKFRSIGTKILESSYPQYADEYLNLLILLGFVKRVKRSIVIQKETRLMADKFTYENRLSAFEMEVFRRRLLSTDLIVWFLKEIFKYEPKGGKGSPRALKLKDIAKEYSDLTGLSPTTSRREAKLIKDWLGQVGLLEQSYSGKYYLAVSNISFELFERLFREKYDEIEKSKASRTKWKEIAPIQASICEEFSISKEAFDSHFRRLVDSNKEMISVSPGSAGIKDVRKFGVKMNNKLVSYIKFNR